MLLDSRLLQPNDTLEADVCIVGSGPAGLTLASKLEGASKSVLVLESGGAEQPESSAQNLSDGALEFCAAESGEIIHRDTSYLRASRVRHLGGSSNHWSNWCRRLDPVDFQKRSWVAESGWPFTLSELEKYYDQAFIRCGVPRPYEGKNPQGMVSIFDGQHFENQEYRICNPPVNFARALRSLIEASPNIRLFTHATVTDLEFSESARALSHLTVTSPSGVRFQVKAKTFVLAAGGIENARLLLLSRSATALPGYQNVGRYFMEHPHFICGHMTLLEISSSKLENYNALQTQSRVLVLTPTPEIQEKLGLLNIQFDLDPVTSTDSLRFAAAATNALYKTNQERHPFVLRLRAILEHAPRKESRIELSSEKDEYNQPRARVVTMVGNQERHSMIESLRLFQTSLGSRLLGRVRCSLGEEWTSEKFKSEFFTYGYHHLGTTRMSSNGQQGVVDSHCKLHGCDNAFMAGSSVFPTSGHAPPTATIVALALRLSDHLNGSMK